MRKADCFAFVHSELAKITWSIVWEFQKWIKLVILILVYKNLDSTMDLKQLI